MGKTESSWCDFTGKLECTEFCLGGPSLDAAFPNRSILMIKNDIPVAHQVVLAWHLQLEWCLLQWGRIQAARYEFQLLFAAFLNKTNLWISELAWPFPLSGSLDHAGPMARTSRDCALCLMRSRV